ncbi:MAG: hypothetical protein U0640_09190 [Phycisphaerales bacterium]
MQNRGARNNTLAGLFVVASLVLGVWVAFMLADRGAGMNATRFIVRFPVEQGAAGISLGSPVLLGGQQVGQVIGISFGEGAKGDKAGKDVPASSVDVRVEVREDVALFENAQVYLEKPLLGSLSNINVVTPGTDTLSVFNGKSAKVENGEVLVAGVAPGLLAQAGLGPTQLDQLKRTLENVDKSVLRLTQLIDKSSPDVETAIADVRTVIADAKSNFAGWDKSIDTTLSNMESASGRVDPLFTKIEKSVDSATSVFEESRAIVTENRKQIEQILASVRSATDRLDKESVDLLNGALKDARGAMAQAQTAITDVNALITEQRPNLRKSLANIRLTSDQLKLAAVEVRSQPWRLFHEPNTKELSAQVLYDSTRNYAQAASDVRAASEALTELSLTQRTGQTMTDADLAVKLAELSKNLQESMTSFQQAEKELLEKLVKESK